MKPPSRLEVDYFDGVWRHPRLAHMWIDQGMLQIVGKGIIRQVPLIHVQWQAVPGNPTMQRVARLPCGSFVHGSDAAQWDCWVHAHQGTLISQRYVNLSLRWATVSVLLLLVVAVGTVGYLWLFKL